MRHLHRLVWLAPVVLLFVNSCKKEGCNDPLAFNYDPEGTTTDNCIYEPMQVSVSVSPFFGNDPFQIEQAFEIQDGRAITIDYYGLYLSELSFREEGDSSFSRWTNDVMLLKSDQTAHDELYLRTKKLNALQFVVGVDSSVYTGDPTDTAQVPSDSPLAPQAPSMYWGWADGYRYISLTGSVDTSDAKDGSGMAEFEYHVGLPSNLVTVTFEDIELETTGNSIPISLRLDIRKLFENIDFKTELVTHTSDAPELAEKIATNAISAFTME